MMVNSYSSGISGQIMANMLNLSLPKGNVFYEELGLPIKENTLVLPCGNVAIWESKK
jgi:23S rRNA (cytosine1962-C5)-methyltransferase